MKKLTYAAFVLVILAISSCTKKSTPTPPGSWILHNISHTAAFCVFDQGSLVAADAYADTISFTFFNNALPTTGGQYAVVMTPTAANQVAIYAGAGQTPYIATAGGTAYVSISGGKISISGTSISMTNPNPPATDTTYTTFSLSQQ